MVMLSIKCVKKIIPWLLLSVVIIFTYNGLMYGLCGPSFTSKDPFCKTALKSKVFGYLNHNGSEACSYWPVLHLLWFAILAFFFPDCWKELFVFGIVWEIIETGLGAALQKFAPGDLMVRDNPTGQYDGQWWSGSLTDIVFNTIGIILGVLLAKMRRND